MPHLYLPRNHTDADLVLAADVAAAVSSADLYVTWTHAIGPCTPEVEAVLRDERAPQRRGPFAELMVALAQGIAAVWRRLTFPPAQGSAPQRVPHDPARRAGEPSL